MSDIVKQALREWIAKNYGVMLKEECTENDIKTFLEYVKS
jgi:hypothetical protein